MFSESAYFSSTTIILALVTFLAFEGQGSMDPSKADEWARAERCVRITSTLDVPFLEKQLSGDVLVTCTALSKLHCEDLCMRNPHCIGYNYKEHKCEILRDIYDAYEKRMSQGTRAFMKTFLLGRGQCMNQ